MKTLKYKDIEWNKAYKDLRKLKNELVVAYRSKEIEKVK